MILYVDTLNVVFHTHYPDCELLTFEYNNPTKLVNKDIYNGEYINTWEQFKKLSI